MKLKGLAVRCSFAYEVEFTTQDIPAVVFKESVDDGRYVDIPAEVETAEMRLVWRRTDEKLKRVQSPNQSSAKVTRFACLTNKDPALQP